MPNARRRGRRRQNRGDAFGEALLEVPLDQRPYLLRLQVIGIVIAGREHIGADHDAPADFLPEAGGARPLVHVGDVAAALAQAVKRTPS